MKFKKIITVLSITIIGTVMGTFSFAQDSITSVKEIPPLANQINKIFHNRFYIPKIDYLSRLIKSINIKTLTKEQLNELKILKEKFDTQTKIIKEELKNNNLTQQQIEEKYKNIFTDYEIQIKTYIPGE